MDQPVPVPGIDPSGVHTPQELSTCLDGLRHRRGLSYSKLTAKAAKLPRRDGKLQTLPTSTVGDMLRGPKVPSKDKLLTFLTACEVSDHDLPQWLAAWERASTADLRRPPGDVRVRTAQPRQLGVHAAIRCEGADGELPAYVSRDVDGDLQATLSRGAEQGCFVLLVGGSSVGKTRTLYEAVLATLPDWWLAHPGDPDELRALAAAPTPRTVIWLDELQRYLGGAQGTAATVRSLLRAGVVLLGTLWPAEYITRTALRRAEPDDPYAHDRELLDLAQVIDVNDAFSAAEQGRAQELAATDARIRTALDTPDCGLTQVLAAGPQLVHWWEAANPYAKAVITFSVDAPRLGSQATLTRELLVAAVPGYLTSAQRASASNDWLERALEYATTPLHGAAATLTPVDDGTMGGSAGYVAADYLLQHGYLTRRAICPPASAWQALVDHTHHPEDTKRLAYSADVRWRFQYAEPLFRRRAEAGDWLAADRLADLLAKQDRVDEAIDVLRVFADAGDSVAAGRLTELLVRRGSMDELRTRADAGDWVATGQLVELLIRRGSIDELRRRANAGDMLASGWLVDLEHGQLHVEKLRARADAGDRLAAGHLAELLVEQGRVDEAIDVLRAYADAGDTLAAIHLDDLLARHGRVDELRERAGNGDGWAVDQLNNLQANHHSTASSGHIACRFADLLIEQDRTDEAIDFLRAYDEAAIESADDYLAELLAHHRRIDELRARADTGEWSASSRLAKLLAEEGRVDELRARADIGDSFAAWRLAEFLAEQGDVDRAVELLKTLAGAGDDLAAAYLPDLLARHGLVEELQTRAADDPWFTGPWIAYLADQERTDDAIDFLQERVDLGDSLAASQLADLLVTQGRVDDAIEILRPHTRGYGNGPAVHRLVELLAECDRTEDLRAEVDAGASGAADRLIRMWLQQGKIGELEAAHMCSFGLNADGSIAGSRTWRST